MNEKIGFIKRFLKDDPLPFPCPFCKRNSLYLLPETWCEYDHSEKIYSEDWFEASDHVELTYTAFYKCSNISCNQQILSSGVGGIDIDYIQEEYVEYKPEYYSYYQPKIFIPVLHFFSIPENTPDEIKKLLELSFSIILQSPSSAVNSLRTSIETLLDLFLIPKKRLHRRIEDDVSKNLHLSPYQEHLMAIKWLGNSGSHDLDEITLQDLVDAYEFVEHVLVGLYGENSNTLKKVQLINHKKGPLSRQDRKDLRR